MGTNTRELDERGYALCGVCRKKFFISDLEDQCGICGKWFCRDCGRTVPEGHGFGTICKNCYNQIKREDSRKK